MLNVFLCNVKKINILINAASKTLLYVQVVVILHTYAQISASADLMAKGWYFLLVDQLDVIISFRDCQSTNTVMKNKTLGSV